MRKTEIVNDLGLSEFHMEFIKTLQAQYDSGESDFTATSLLKPVREIVLWESFVKNSDSDKPFKINASSLMAASNGTALHLAVENLIKSDEAEVRLYSTLNYGGKGFVISGQLDRLVNGEIRDMKFISDFSMNKGMKEEWVQQLNIQLYLATRNGRQVRRLWIDAINIGASIPRIVRGQSVPSRSYEIPMWDMETTEAFIEDRIEKIMLARATRPECTPEERWTRGAYRCVKEIGGRASRTFDTEMEALAYCDGKGLIIEENTKPEDQTKCCHYCPVASVCSQFKGYKGETVDDTEHTN